MTYGTTESSRYLGEPVNLYLFRYGDQAAQIYAYTDAEEPIVLEGEGITYIPLPIDRGKIVASGSLDKATMTVSTPADSALAKLYLVYPPSGVTTLLMRQGHLTDPDAEFPVVWTGRVLSCTRKGSKAEFTCEPVTTQLRRNGLRRRYQFGCPHALYGPECRASKSAATTVVTVVTVSGTRVTLSPNWSDRAEKHAGGIAEWQLDDLSTEMRTIKRVENGGTVLLLSGPTRGLVAGMEIKAILGCNHKAGIAAQQDGDCGPLHDNILNFGGMPFIPLKNPISMTNMYY